MFKQQFSTTTPVNTVTARVTDAKDALVSDGRDAVVLSAEILAGQTALAVLRTFVVPAKTSLVDKLTGKGAFIKKVVNSAYGSLAIASIAHVGVQMFAPNNAKLHRITQLALNAAMVEAASQINIQGYVDAIADKLMNNAAMDAVLGKAQDTVAALKGDDK